MDVIAALWIIANFCCFLVTTVYAFRDNAYCPAFLHDLFEWGKTKKKKDCSWWRSWFHVPNSSWFMHFYLVGVAWTSLLLLVLANTCFGNSSEIPLLKYFIHLIMPTPNKERQVNCASVLLGLLLLLFQVSRRLYECLFVSIFSGRIHLVHYFVGICFYLLVGATIVSPMVTIHEGWCHSCEYLLSNIKLSHLLGIAVFMWASWHQYRCHKILAELRHPTRTAGRPNNNYQIPYGDFFEYVSSPHYFAEIIIYMAFNIVQGGDNRRMWFMLIFVIQNLTLGATVTQQWYLKKFENYPKNRYVLLPFIY